MHLLAHENQEEANASAVQLREMGAHARRLLGECVEHQELKKSQASTTAERLYDAGFIFIRELGCPTFPKGVSLRPSLAGEEALDALERLEQSRHSTRADN